MTLVSSTTEKAWVCSHISVYNT